MKQFFFLAFIFGLVACQNDEAQKTTSPKEETKVKSDSVNKKELVHIVGDVFTEYYPDKVTIKFQGPQDEEGRRHGKWLFFSEDGEERSMTMYHHGKKHGHSIVKYPNGGIHYLGEYQNDRQVGVWKTYQPNGKLATTKDYGYPEE